MIRVVTTNRLGKCFRTYFAAKAYVSSFSHARAEELHDSKVTVKSCAVKRGALFQLEGHCVSIYVYIVR